MRTRSGLLAPATLLLLLAGCGQYEGAVEESAGTGTAQVTPEETPEPTVEESPEMPEADPSMNDPEATPADQVDGELASGAFALVDSPPPGFDSVSGDAYLAQNAEGTTVTIRVSGLEPLTDYMAHLHQERCSADSGGDHFAFDPTGEAAPPNEIHLGFTTNGTGSGEATVVNDRRVGNGAPSVVVHTSSEMEKVACADFR